MKLFFLFCGILLLINCENFIKKEIKINTHQGEQCFYFLAKKSDTLRFDRRIQILKNTLSDTILFGYAILAPGQIGQIGYARLGNRNDVLLDLRYKNPKTDRICISPYKKKEARGVLVIKLDTL